MKQAVAEFIGTMTLVLFGCGAAVIAGADIGLTGISFAFGLALIGMAYGIGGVSGCHINPAVTGVSVNPAWSFGPALFAGGHALSQLWHFVQSRPVGRRMKRLVKTKNAPKPQGIGAYYSLR